MLTKGLFKKPQNSLESYGKYEMQPHPEIPDEMCVTCPSCKTLAFTEELNGNTNVCPKCGYHFRINPRRRIAMLTDPGSFTELDGDLTSVNRIGFPDYEKKLKSAMLDSGENEAVVCGTAKIEGYDCAIFVMDPFFMMGSMGTVVGEKITRLFEYATKESLPVIGYTVSGGARMQEGTLSLLQMAKTTGAVKRHSDAGNLYITVLTDPTTGGVTASFAMEGDIILAEPGALIGFAGPRVIEQTIRQKLPQGFQRAEFLVEKGFVDAVVKRKDQKNILRRILALHQDSGMRVPVKHAGESRAEGAAEAAAIAAEGIGRRLNKSKQKEKAEITAYDRVMTARAKNRATAIDYINQIFEEFIEMHGDRRYGDDPAVIAGIGSLRGMPVTICGIEKGHDTKDKIAHNFGGAHPEGYRKTLRQMKLAEKFGRPVICFVDTSGAYCGLGAEERGQGQAIAENMSEMMTLSVPIITVLIGEGGSGGALALSVADQVWMLENAVYSVISPEGCASILWKDSAKAAEAAECLKITAEDLLSLGLIERIVKEPKGRFSKIYENLRMELYATLVGLEQEEKESLLDNRYGRYRKVGAL